MRALSTHALPGRRWGRLAAHCALALWVGTASSRAASPDTKGIRQALQSGDFARIEAHLHALQDEFARDFRAEDAMGQVYRGFRHLELEASPQLDAWRAAFPESPFARAASGHFHLGNAWQVRGGGAYSTLGAKRISEMRRLATLARENFEAALAREPALVAAYEGLIEVGQLLSDRALSRAGLDRALSLDSRLFGPRDRYQTTLMRRWGGSHEAIEQVGREAQRELARNPKLALLLGMDDWDRSLDAIAAHAYADAEILASRALESGPHWRFFYARGWARRLLGHGDAALADLDEASELRPDEPLVMHQRAHVLADLDRYGEARAAIQEALSVEPRDAHYRYVARQIEAAIEWQAFLAAPTARQALGYAIGFLFVHVVDSLVLLVAVWVGVRIWRRSRSKAGKLQSTVGKPGAATPTLRPTDPLGVHIWRAYVWIALLLQVNSFYVRAPGFRGVGEWLDVAIMALSFLGAVAYLHRRRLLTRRFWQIWAPAFPVLVVIAHFTVYDAKLYEWPAWGFVHVTLLPIYGALYAYGYRSNAIWPDDENPYASALAAIDPAAASQRAADL